MLRNILLVIFLLGCLPGCIESPEQSKGTFIGYVVQKDTKANRALLVSDTESGLLGNEKVYDADWIAGIADQVNVGEKVTVETIGVIMTSYPGQTSGTFLSKEKLEKPEGAVLEPEEALRKAFEQEKTRIPTVKKISLDNEKKVWNVTLYDNSLYKDIEVVVEDRE
ncbi:YobA family protein [Paenibacillus chitinolyticus]|uniref:YobA family protein n=1 Tax=Paenibacillus chitinolyticus TaxID=79263 RepID=UPI001C49782C|nr:YobA family protein [Paenibacillus chitinolyticus]MBV6713585.1 YobA family protein [Paenibacillus chitinolyticus]